MPPAPTRPEATFAFSRTRNASAPDDRASRRSRRSASTAIVCSERTTPSPPHVGQVRVRISRTPAVTFWRVISTSPSGEISTRYVFVRSFSSSAWSTFSTSARFFADAMSMKSMTMMPPMSRSRSWRMTSRAASMLLRVIVSSSRPDEPTNRPVLTSMTVNASA